MRPRILVALITRIFIRAEENTNRPTVITRNSRIPTSDSVNVDALQMKFSPDNEAKYGPQVRHALARPGHFHGGSHGLDATCAYESFFFGSALHRTSSAPN
jgi:hypothetical protein